MSNGGIVLSKNEHLILNPFSLNMYKTIYPDTSDNMPNKSREIIT